MTRYIYFVGKPYPRHDILQAIRQSGYLVGVFLDKNVTLQNPGDYDSVVPVDFSSAESLFHDISAVTLRIAGLLCTYENYITAKSLIGDRLNLPVADFESALMCTDKFLMRQAFQKRDPAITPGFALIGSVEEAIAASQKLHYPLIIKPTNLVKSLLILKCNDQVELVRNFAYVQAKIKPLYEQYRVYGREPRVIVEEYISGKQCSVAAFVDSAGQAHFREGIVSLVTAQEKGANDNYIYARQLPADLPKALTSRLLAVATEGIKALGMKSTPAHVELIYSDEGIKLIEIGARIGGYRPRMYNYSYGIDLIRAEIAIAVGDQPDLAGSFNSYCAVYELFPAKQGAFSSLEGVADTTAFDYFSLKAKAGQSIGPAKDGYKAAAVIIIRSADENKFATLSDSVNKIKVVVS